MSNKPRKKKKKIKIRTKSTASQDTSLNSPAKFSSSNLTQTTNTARLMNRNSGRGR